MHREMRDSLKLIDEEESLEFGRYKIKVGRDVWIVDSETGVGERVLEGKWKVLKAKESKEEALFYALKEGEDEIAVLSFFYPMEGIGGVRMDRYAIKLPFKLSRKFLASSSQGELLLWDKGKYILYLSGDLYQGSLKGALKVKALGKGRGIIIAKDGVHIIERGKRAFIENKRLPEKAGKAKYYGILREKYVLIGWEKKVIIVGIEKEEFRFGVFELNPFDRLLE